MKLVWRILGRFYGARARRASKQAARLMERSETFFRRIKGGRQ